MNEPGGIPGQNIPVLALLALAATRSFGSPEETDMQPLVLLVRALFCYRLLPAEIVFLSALSFPVCRCSLAMQELVPTRPLKLL